MKFEYECFNRNRYSRGADAARVMVTQDDGATDLLWMSKTDISKNVALFGPHFALVKAAGQYGIRIAPLVAAWRDGSDTRFLKPLDVVRTCDGYYAHPDWAEEENSELVARWLDLIGFEMKAAWLEHDHSDAAADVRKRYATGDTDILAWDPKSPEEAAGWFIASIHDSEDGPLCIWIRDKAAANVQTN